MPHDLSVGPFWSSARLCTAVGMYAYMYSSVETDSQSSYSSADTAPGVTVEEVQLLVIKSAVR